VEADGSARLRAVHAADDGIRRAEATGTDADALRSVLAQLGVA
jgi:hypothetical protein